ncbi:hypothetical protein LTR53_006143 [Teratosphaeriaceae sp. CCFEE 6253]|nr:hypothetical protein LTR53_006143 [Teratosphaeriaceae sp. CCFEE 6253]
MASAVPAGHSPAAHPLSPDDRSGWAVVASGIALLFILLFAGIRLWVRNPVRATLFPDDLALFAASGVAAIQCILVIAAADRGLGQTTTLLGAATEHAPCDRLLYAGDAFFLAALFLSKISVLFLELRLSPERWHVLLTKAGLVACSLAAIACPVMILVGCGSRPWTQLAAQCDSLYTRWIVVFCIDAALELHIFAVILRMLAALQRKARNKLTATVMFGLRLPVILFAALRLLALAHFRHAPEPLFARVVPVAWTQAELAYSLAAATLPTLIPFLAELNTGLGAFDARGDLVRQTQQESSSASRHVGASYGLQSLKTKRGSMAQRHDAQGGQIRGDIVGFESSVVSPQADQRSVGSDDSTRVIIRKTVDVRYSPAPRAGRPGHYLGDEDGRE